MATQRRCRRVHAPGVQPRGHRGTCAAIQSYALIVFTHDVVNLRFRILQRSHFKGLSGQGKCENPKRFPFSAEPME
jgi:hypothetical protein